MLRRALKYVNSAIGAAVLVLLGCAYWYAWRPLGATSGQLTAPVAARAVASRDSLGVPHILAANLPDALFLQGYVTAQDRLFQMDMLRRVAGGELAEVLGPAALESDRRARRLRLSRIAEESARKLPEPDRQSLAAYARGVNYYLERHRNRLPLEFSVLRYDPRPWTISDSLRVFLNLMNTLERSWRPELMKESLLADGDPAKVDLLFSSSAGGDALPGSNAWAVSGSLTASRRPILAGDPHLELTVPSIWHMVHLRGPRLNVSGVTVPGLPGVLIGHNDRIAWSITSLEADVQDLYLEKLDPASGRYEFGGQVEQARVERDVIRVRGRVPEAAINWVTRHGPIFLAEGGRLFALRWTAFDTTAFQVPVLDLDRARNWEEFRAALARLPGPATSFVYADVAGNIGFQTVGRIPIRENFDGSTPVDGSSGKFEWQGYIPFEKLPTVFNPPSGLIVSANQDPFPKDFPFRVSGHFDPPYRYRQILARLKSRQGWRAEDMLTVQTDVYSAFSHFLAREVVSAYARHSASYAAVADAIELLRNWNGQMSAGRPEPMIATLTYLHLRTSIARRASRAKQPAWDVSAAPAVIEKLLREHPVDWFDDYDKLLLDNFADAVQEGRRIQGRSVARWDYGAYNSMVLDNLILGRLPVVGKYFNIGRVLMGGSPDTVKLKRLGEAFGPSMRMVVDLSNLDASLQNITLGVSGQVLSRHYRDQWDAYLAGRSFPMQFNKIDAASTLIFLPEPR